MLAAERDEVLRIRDAGEADHEVLEQVMGALDLEESMLDRVERAGRGGPGRACCSRRSPRRRVRAPAPGPDARSGR